MKKLLLLAMVLGLLISGCATQKTYVHEEWVKNGATLMQQQKDYLECRGPFYIKPGMTSEEYENDLGSCMEAGLARDRHKRTVGGAVGSASIIPFLGIGAVIAQIAIEAQKDYCVRCMENKGYQKNAQRFSESQINECMMAKGYEWKEITETK